MSLESVLSYISDATGVFNPQVALVLFAICSLGEFGPSIPYLLETVWLLTGYHVARGQLSPFDLMLFWLVAQAGRQLGLFGLYNVSRFGSPSLKKLYKRYLESRLAGKQIIPSGVLKRLANLSPFSVALGRLFGLRIPMTLTLGAQRRWPTLALGVLLSSLIWDSIYLFLGATVGATAVVKPVNMVVFSLIGLTVLYIVTLSLRFLRRLGAADKNSKFQSPDSK